MNILEIYIVRICIFGKYIFWKGEDKQGGLIWRILRRFWEELGAAIRASKGFHIQLQVS